MSLMTTIWLWITAIIFALVAGVGGGSWELAGVLLGVAAMLTTIGQIEFP